MIAAIRRPAFAIPCIAGLAPGIAVAFAVFTAFAAIELESRASATAPMSRRSALPARPTGSRS